MSSYNQHDWTTGEIITANKLNNIEDGIANPDRDLIGNYIDEWLEANPEAIVVGDGTVSKIKLDNTVKTELEQNTANVATLQEKLGDLTGLQTLNHSSVVAAINEIKNDNNSINENILTEAIKTALLQIANKIIYIDENGQEYYNALFNALYPSTGEE